MLHICLAIQDVLPISNFVFSIKDFLFGLFFSFCKFHSTYVEVNISVFPSLSFSLFLYLSLFLSFCLLLSPVQLHTCVFLFYSTQETLELLILLFQNPSAHPLPSLLYLHHPPHPPRYPLPFCFCPAVEEVDYKDTFTGI